MTAAIALALLAAAPAIPAVSDGDVRALARKADKASAYPVHILRFPGGTRRKGSRKKPG